jgi:hypothetical protein
VLTAPHTTLAIFHCQAKAAGSGRQHPGVAKNDKRQIFWITRSSPRRTPARLWNASSVAIIPLRAPGAQALISGELQFSDGFLILFGDMNRRPDLVRRCRVKAAATVLNVALPPEGGSQQPVASRSLAVTAA